MNQGQHGANDGGPFGYEFHGSNNNPNQPPSGPPLLNDNDSVLLRNFFDNPNEFDPNYFTLQNAFQTDANQHIFGNHAPDWLLNLSQQSLNHQANTSATRHMQANFPGQTQAPNPAQTQSAFQDFSPSTSTHGQTSPSEDVYAAARYLQQQSPASQRNSGQTYQYSNPQQHAQPSAHSMYNYSPNTPQSGNSYTFGQLGSSNGYYNTSPVTGQQNYSEDANFAGNAVDNRQKVGPDSRHGPLKFGSDEKFQSPHYGGASDEHPDAQLTEILNHHIQPKNGALTSQTSTGSESLSKKRRSSDEDNGGVGHQGSPQSLTRAPPNKRRKSRGQSQGEGSETPTGTSKQNRRSKSGQTGSGPFDSPRSVKRSSTASKPARENLTEDQKRSNHILSEQKRRDLIKNGFEDINRMVPELRSGGFSKSNMLLEAAKFMRELRDGNEELKARLSGIENG